MYDHKLFNCAVGDYVVFGDSASMDLSEQVIRSINAWGSAWEIDPIDPRTYLLSAAEITDVLF